MDIGPPGARCPAGDAPGRQEPAPPAPGEQEREYRDRSDLRPVAFGRRQERGSHAVHRCTRSMRASKDQIAKGTGERKHTGKDARACPPPLVRSPDRLVSWDAPSRASRARVGTCARLMLPGARSDPPPAPSIAVMRNANPVPGNANPYGGVERRKYPSRGCQTEGPNSRLSLEIPPRALRTCLLMNRRSFLTTIGAFATAVVGERLVRPRDSIEPVPFDGKQESCPALSPSPPAGPPQPGTMTGGAPAPSITSEDIRRAADLLDEHAVPMDGRVLWVNREAFEVLRERAQVEAEVCDRSRVSSLIGPYHQTYFHGIEIRPITFSNWSRPDFRGRIYSDYARELGRAMATREDEMVQDILTRSS